MAMPPERRPIVAITTGEPPTETTIRVGLPLAFVSWTTIPFVWTVLQKTRLKSVAGHGLVSTNSWCGFGAAIRWQDGSTTPPAGSARATSFAFGDPVVNVTVLARGSRITDQPPRLPFGPYDEASALQRTVRVWTFGTGAAAGTASIDPDTHRGACGYPASASAPATTSRISCVISACLARFIASVSVSISSPAFFEALRMALICAPRNDAADSSSAR